MKRNLFLMRADKMKFNYLVKILLVFTIIFHQSHAAEKAPRKTMKEISGMVETYCGACHNPPSPRLLPKKSWPYVIDTMADLARDNLGENYISEDQVRDITAYYYGSSPEKLPSLPYHYINDKDFSLEELGEKSVLPLVVNIKSVNLFNNENSEFLVCDSEKNQVSLLTRTKGKWIETVLAEIEVPSHTEVVDYDFDGDKDIIVAALGLFFPPQGSNKGGVYLLRQNSSGEFIKETILENVGRVTDAQAIDIDGDADLDIAISIFGADVPGELAWLENIGSGKYIKHKLLNASGGLNISPIDLNDDGLIDFVSLISQDHELVAGLVNTGKGSFKRIPLFKASNPLVGFSSMRLVDLDGDKDVDLLFANGDANDLQMDPKPYHGVQWLENKGNLNFEYHEIGRFYGAVSAVAGDLDADGDLDIVASSWNNYWDDPKRQSLIWYENDGKQNFVRHNITAKPASITTLELEDVTGDGLIDIIAGVFNINLLKKIYESENGETPDQGKLKSRIILLKNNKINRHFVTLKAQ